MEQKEFIERAISSFPFFIENIFPLSFKNPIPALHLSIWGERIQNNKKTATLSARKHLKSTLMYAYLMWRLFKMSENEGWLYMSYTETLSRYHTSNIKKLIRANKFFRDFKDLSSAESTLRYTLDEKNIFSVMPGSILRFNRGWHDYGVICLTPETKIKTNQGIKEIKNISKKDMVLSHTNKYQRVTDTFKRYINKNIFKIELENGEIIRITGNHRIKTKRGWIRADKLKKDDELEEL